MDGETVMDAGPFGRDKEARPAQESIAGRCSIIDQLMMFGLHWGFSSILVKKRGAPWYYFLSVFLNFELSLYAANGFLVFSVRKRGAAIEFFCSSS